MSLLWIGTPLAQVVGLNIHKRVKHYHFKFIDSEALHIVLIRNDTKIEKVNVKSPSFEVFVEQKKFV